MYTDRNFKTKKALKEALAMGKEITIYQPGFGDTPSNGMLLSVNALTRCFTPILGHGREWTYFHRLNRSGRIGT